MQKARLVIVAVLLLLVVALGFFAGHLFQRFIGLTSRPKFSGTTAIVQQVQTLAQLVTVKYVMEKVVIGEDPKWYGDSRVILVAHGIVKAGIDFQKLTAEDVRLSGKKISIRLPPAAILDVHLDDELTEVVERNTGVLRQFDKDLEQNARRQALGSLRAAAHRHGILKDANERARLQLTVLFKQLGFEEVEFLTHK